MGKTKEFMKKSVGLIVAVPLVGAALGMIGNAGMIGGTGRATQVAVSGGFLSHVSKMFKWK